MKRFMFLLTVLCLVTLPLAACGDSGKPATKTPIAQTDLVNHTFVLTTIDGKAYAGTGEVPFVTFGQEMGVSGAVCSAFTGKGTLTGATLMVKDLAATKKECADPALNALDTELPAMLTSGADLTLVDKKLTISKDKRSLDFMRK